MTTPRIPEAIRRQAIEAADEKHVGFCDCMDYPEMLEAALDAIEAEMELEDEVYDDDDSSSTYDTYIQLFKWKESK